MAKRVVTSKKKPTYDCDDVERYLDKAITKVKDQIMPKIENLDKRDRDQYEFAKKIIKDANSVSQKRIEASEKIVEAAQKEIDRHIENQERNLASLADSLSGLHVKLDAHISDENSEFRSIKESFEAATVGVEKVQFALENVQVNGGTYPLGEAMKHIYNQHVETHKKLDDVAALVEPIAARRRWVMASKELIKKNGILHFILTTRPGAILGTVLVLMLVNTIAKDVFNYDLDILNIFRWFFGLFKSQ